MDRKYHTYTATKRTLTRMAAETLALCLMAVSVLFVSCSQDDRLLIDRKVTMDKQMFHFGFKNYNEVTVTTRSTLPSIAEARVINFYLLVFDNSGNTIYGHYFDQNSCASSNVELLEMDEGWIVDNLDPDQGKYSNGSVRFKCPPVTDGHLYMIANLNPDRFNINKDLLSTIDSEDQLTSLVCEFTQNTLERSGLFMMVGQTTVTIMDNEFTITPGELETCTWGTLPDVGECLRLIRNDAKITVNVGVVPGAVTHRMVHDHVLGTDVDVYQVIEDFEPTSWQLVNVPNSAWLIGRSEATKFTDAVSGAAEIKTPSLEHYFEAVREESCNGYDATDKTHPIEITDGSLKRNVHTFGFYMLENHKQADESTVGEYAIAKYGADNIGYNLRDKRRKNSDGSYLSGMQWEFAPDKGTYLVIKGVVKMKYDDTAIGQQTLNANVTYYIHLGDFTPVASRPGSGPDNYCIDRNTNYTYNVNIKGVNNIQVEVELDNDGSAWNDRNEKQSGATGRVYVAQEEVVTFDSHYGQRVYRFNADKIMHIGEVENLTWSVFTPFGRNGSPERVGVAKIEVPNGLDYKWVHFILNTKEASYIEPHAAADGGEKEIVNDQYPNYCQKNRWWLGDDPANSMDVIAFCTFLRNELVKYRTLRDEYLAAHPGMLAGELASDPAFGALVSERTAFDSERNILATVFIDEFYYDTDPISGAARASLWHQFVNQPDRAMHIMCDARGSNDGESQVVGTAVTIYQRSIQSIYNTEYATEGWGTETDGELGENAKFYNRTEQQSFSIGVSESWVDYNTYNMNDNTATSFDNGRYNSACFIGLVNGTLETNLMIPWSQYLDYSRTNSEIEDEHGYWLMVEDDTKATMRYAWLARNRDNNGNGRIDVDEIKWYMASINQLKELFIGDRGISTQSRLYNIETPDNTKTNASVGYWKWRSHVVSSTLSNSYNSNGSTQPIYIWAEEGGSVSPYGKEFQKNGRLSSRCVRNLEDHDVVRQIADRNDHPESVIEMTDNGDGTYTFDMSRLNTLSINIASTGELLPLDENSSQSRPAKIFQTGPVGNLDEHGNIKTYTKGTYSTFQNSLLLGKVINPEGYRTPTYREMLIIHNKLSGVANFWKIPGKTDNATYGCVNYYSFGNQNVGGKGFDPLGQSWGFLKTNISIEDNAAHYIRCVKSLE